MKAKTKAANKAGQTITIVRIGVEKRTYCILGHTPLIMNRLSKKAMEELLYPSGEKTKADKAQNLKHDPIAEFNSAPHRFDNPRSDTLLALPTTAIKAAMREAALRMPGSSKKEIGQLCYIRGDLLPVYGTPQLLMSAVRNSDMNRTPDIRTRVILPKWALFVTVEFVTPNLTHTSIDALLAGAGQIIGVGDWRPEKGSGTYGMFEICDERNPEFRKLVRKEARRAQEKGMRVAEPFNSESAELLSWFQSEIKRRGDQVKMTTGRAKRGMSHLPTPARSRGNGLHVGA